MKIPYLSGLRVSGKLELKNLQEQINATKYLTIDVNNNVTWSSGNSGGGSGNVDLSNYFTKSQSDAKYQLKGNYLTSVQWSDVTGRPTSLSQFTNDSAYVTASIINGLAKSVDVYTKTVADGRFQMRENQRLSSNNEVSFSKVKAVNELVLPSSTSNVNGAIWIGNANSTGHTAPTVTTLASLQDVSFSNLQNGQSIAFDSTSGKWINRSYLTSVSWNDILNRPVALSQFNNDLGFVNGDGTSTIGFIANDKDQPYLKYNTTNEIIGIAKTSGINIDVTAYRIRLGLGSNAYESKTLLSQYINDLGLGSNAYESKTALSQFTNDLGLGSNAYESKTNLSQFTNDLGNYGGFLLSDGATYAGFAGNDVNNPYMRHTSSNDIVYLSRTNASNIDVNAYRTILGLGSNAYESKTLLSEYVNDLKYIQAEYNSGGSELPSYFGSNKLKLNMLWMEEFGWMDALWMSSYSGGDVKQSNQILFGKTNSNIAGFRSQDFDSNTWGTFNEFYHTASQKVEAPILKATSKMVIPTSVPAQPENGAIWIS